MKDPQHGWLLIQQQVALPKLGLTVDAFRQFPPILPALIKQTAIDQRLQNTAVQSAGTGIELVGLVFRTIKGFREVLATGTMYGFDVHHVEPDIPVPKHPVFLAHEQPMRIFKKYILRETMEPLKAIRKQCFASFAQQQFALVVAHQL